MAEAWRDRYARPSQRERVYTLPGEDGYLHERDERGWCKTCMAPPGCSHARCKEAPHGDEDRSGR